MRFRTVHRDRGRTRKEQDADPWDMSYDEACRLASQHDRIPNPEEEITSAIDQVRSSFLRDMCESSERAVHGSSADRDFGDWERQQEIERRKRLEEMQQDLYRNDFPLPGS